MPLTFYVNPNKTVDILAKQGESWEFVITITDSNGNPFDLTGYSVKAYIKSTYQDESPVATFNCQIEDALSGKIKLTLSSTVTSQIEAYPTSADGVRISNLKAGTQGVYVYDVKIYNDTKAIRVLEGKLVVDPQVSD